MSIEPLITDVGRKYLTWSLVDGIGPIILGRLLYQFGEIDQTLGLKADLLQTVHGIGPQKSEAIARSRDRVDIASELEAAEEFGVRILCREDAGYPEGLKRIPDPPIVLYVRGDLRATDHVSLAIVGSRRCTIYGSEQARRFGELLAGAGFTVVSGLARGIDAFAHHGAVDAGGRTIAALGSGLNEIYPSENRGLAEQMLDNGALVSELPMRTSVRREHFPSRNRIIAGMTLGTVVIEAAKRSGALITARMASEYNREVFALPGRVQDPMSQGTNALIRDSHAKLVTCLDDILDELGEVGYQMQLRTAPDREESGLFSEAEDREGGSARRAPAMSDVERRVFDAVPFDAVMQDVVLRACALPPGEALAALTSLELKGLIKRLPGNLVVRQGKA